MRGVSYPCQPIGLRGAGKRMEVVTAVGLGRGRRDVGGGRWVPEGYFHLKSVSVLALRSSRVSQQPRTTYSRWGTRGAPKHAFPRCAAGRYKTDQEKCMALRTKHERASALEECSPSFPQTNEGGPPCSASCAAPGGSERRSVRISERCTSMVRSSRPNWPAG